MRQFRFSVSPTYAHGPLPVLAPQPLHFWIMLPAIALAAMTYALVWAA